MLHLLLPLTLAIQPCPTGVSPVCTCVPRPQRPPVGADIQAAIDQGSVFFAARVLEKDDAPRRPVGIMINQLAVTMVVAESWNPVASGTVVVLTPTDSEACGADLDVGKTYFIEANLDDMRDLHTTKCSWTRPLTDAKELVELLRSMRR